MSSGLSNDRVVPFQREEGGANEPRVEAMALAAPPPRATYRLQFHKGFTFDNAAAIVPYLAKLGVSHVYASPLQTARPGSTHGYDIVDHTAINPELGGAEGFQRLSAALKAHDLGLILDIVPNHMGIGGADNAWWLSVIEWGQLSPQAPAFDIDWERLAANGKLVLPFLGKRYGEALEEGELKLAFDEEQGGFSIWHFEHRFPITPLSYPVILDRMLMLAEPSEPAFREALAISARLRTLSEGEPNAQTAGLFEACEDLKQRLAEAVRSSDLLKEALARAIDLINGAVGIPESFDTLHRILEMQSYRLAYWRVATSEINYRRFFDINTLAGVRVEDPAIFQATHALIFALVREGKVQGLRIDHIDGLADPDGYVHALQAELGPGFYILAEKILGHGETLRPWPMSGTTGYDVLNLIDGVLVDRAAEKPIVRAYREATGQDAGYEDRLRQAKREVLQGSFASELEGVVSDLARIALADRRTRDYTPHGIRRVLVEIIERFPVYRSYVAGDATPEDRQLIEETVAAAAEASALPDQTLHRFIARALLGDIATDEATGVSPEHLARFRRRFQQLTGPVTAKSVEDTLFYRYVPLLALNEVGGEPGTFGFSPDAFHAANAERYRSWPDAMIATATHDTKRGEDGRARLLALSEIPERWSELARLWPSSSLQWAADANAPDANDRHMILQQLLASWPIALLEEDDREELTAFRDRMQGWVEKALREAKRHTSWTNPREAYETAAKDLIARLLEPGSRFLSRFRPLAQELASRGMVKSLSRTVLKLTLPGVPDLYQGTEFWDFSLVDPDNRRPVDYAIAEQALAGEGSVSALLASWKDGRIKQSIVNKLLLDRAGSPELYAKGDYSPVAVDGPRGDEVLAFERSEGSQSRLILVARLTGAEPQSWTMPLGRHWDGLSVKAAGHWRDVLTGAEFSIGDDGMEIADILAVLPVAVLERL